MKRFILSLTFISVCVCICAQNMTSFESSYEAVEHMRLGWNLGNTLDSNSGDTLNMWIEHWTDCTPAVYEKAWGQTVVKPELFRLFKEAGHRKGLLWGRRICRRYSTRSRVLW